MEKGKLGFIRLVDISRDTTTQMRQINDYTIMEYYQWLRDGNKFRDPIVVEKGTNRLVCGWHRFGAYVKALNPTEAVPCIYKEYPSERELLADAVKDNLANGRPLTTYDRKCIIIKMQESGASLDEVAALLGTNTRRLEALESQSVTVVDAQGNERLEALKRDFVSAFQGQTVTEDQYAILKRGGGVLTIRLARALIHHLASNNIDDEDGATIDALGRLYRELGVFLAQVAVA